MAHFSNIAPSATQTLAKRRHVEGRPSESSKTCAIGEPLNEEPPGGAFFLTGLPPLAGRTFHRPSICGLRTKVASRRMTVRPPMLGVAQQRRFSV